MQEIHQAYYHSAMTVQKFLKGYLVMKRIEPQIIDIKLTQNLDFFDKMKSRLYIDFQIKAAYVWRKKLR